MERQESMEAARPRIGLYIHLVVYVVVNAFLVAVNLVTTPDQLWFQWPLVGWGLGILFHAGLLLYLSTRPGGGQRRIAPELGKKARNKHRSHTN
ncbi:MAG: 2TM domain-containing protein [Gemmataceae bacterium]|nr:2TM domain-containing protein [Gemmataceae bacterium]